MDNSEHISFNCFCFPFLDNTTIQDVEKYMDDNNHYIFIDGDHEPILFVSTFYYKNSNILEVHKFVCDGSMEMILKFFIENNVRTFISGFIYHNNKKYSIKEYYSHKILYVNDEKFEYVATCKIV